MDKSKLKKLLTTASAFAMIAGASTQAMGAVVATAGTPVSLGAGANWNGGNAPATGNGASFAGNVTINFDSADFYLTSINMNGNDLTAVNLTENIVLGNVYGGGNSGDITFGAAKVLTLAGGKDATRAQASNYSGIQDIDFNNAAATLTTNTVDAGAINGPGDEVDFVTKNSQAKNAAAATLNVVTDLATKHNSWGTLKTINIGTGAAAATFKMGDDNGVNAIANSGGATVNFLHKDSVLHLTGSGNGFTLANNVKLGGVVADDHGKITILGNGAAVALAGVGSATIGVDNTHRLSELNIDGNQDVTLDLPVYAKQINVGFTGGNGNRVLSFAKVVNAGANSALKLTTANTASVDFALNTTIASFDFNNNDKTINLANNVVYTGNITGDVGTPGNTAGKVVFAGGGKFVGTLTKLTSVTAGNAGAGKVEVSAGNHVVGIFDAKDAASVFEFDNGANITGKIDNTSGNVNNTEVTFLGSGSVSAKTGETKGFKMLNLKGDANSVVKFGHTIDAETINVGNANASGTIQLEGANASDIVGEIKFLDIANGTGRLVVNSDEDHTIGAVTVAQRGDGSAEIEVTANVSGRTIIANGAIGSKADNDKYLKKITLGSGANSNTLQFDADGSHIAEIAVTAGGNNEGGIIKFNTANGKFRIAKVTPEIAGKGHVNIAKDTEFLAVDANATTGIKIGGENTPIALLTIGNGKVLKLAHGSEVYANALTAAAANAGVITFEGDAIFSAASTNAIADINVNGNGKIVKLVKATSVNGNVTIDNNSTLEVAANFTGGNFKGKGAKEGTLRFTNAAASVVTSTIGAGNSLSVIEFAGGNVDLQGDVTHAVGQEFKFAGVNAATVTLNGNTDVVANVFNNTSANGVTHTVVLGKTQAFNGAKLGENAANGNGFINFQLANGIDASLEGVTTANGANFTTGADGTGNLTFKAGGPFTVNSVGADGKQLNKVTFTVGGTVTKNVFAQEVQIDDNMTAKLGGRVKSANLHLDGVNAKVIYDDGAIVDSVTKANAGAKGLVEFAGSATLNEDIGVSGTKVAEVKFSDDPSKALKLNANIYSDDVQMRKGKVVLTNKDVSVDGTKVSAAATSFELGAKKLTVSTLAMSGANNITFSANVNGNVVTGGGIVVDKGGKLDYTAGTTITVTPEGLSSSRPAAGTRRTFTLIANNTENQVVTNLDLDNVDFTPTSDITKWTKEVDANGNLLLVQTDNAGNALKELLGSGATQDQLENVSMLTDAGEGTDAKKVADMLAGFYDAGLKDKVVETLDRLTTTTTVTDNIAGTGGAVSNALGARLDNLAGVQQTGSPVQTREVAAAETGISAGEESARYGVWATPFYNQTVQKARKGAAGYKGTTFGGSFGFDTRANDDLIIGAAVTVANSEMKHKNFKSGDKTKVNSLLFSVYGMQQMTDAWFVNGIATFGTNDVKNNEKRVTTTGYDTVSGKYSSMSFNGEVMFGYAVAMQQVAVTPMAGLRYGRVNDGGYTETGSTNGQNLKVNTKASNKLEAIAGARVSGGTFDVNGMNVTPEVHAFVNHDLIGKTSKPTITLAGAGALATKSRKPIRTTFNVGLGVMANYGMMEYGAGYDADIADKRIGHTGTLKVRVNF